MNKSILWVKVFLLVIILMMLLALVYRPVFSMESNNSGFALNFGGIFNSNDVEKNPNHKVMDSSSSVVIDSDKIKEVDIDLTSGTMKVLYHEEENIILEYEKPTDGRNVLYLEDGDTLKIVSERKNNWFGLGVIKEGDITLKIPEKLVLDYDIDTVNGLTDISVEANEINVDTVSGDVSLAGSARDLEIDTVSGSANIPGDFKDIDFDSMSGDVTITGEFEELKIDTTSGKSTFVISNATEEVSVDTVSGTIYMEDKSDGFFLNFDSLSGKIEDKKNDRRFKSEYYEMGDGRIEVEIDTVSGDLEITH